MNTTLRLMVRIDHASRQADARRALDDACAWLRGMEQRFSRFIPASELCALNRAAGRWFAASEDLYAVVSLAVAAAADSEGLFDPTVLHALQAAGYDRSFELLSDAGQTCERAPQDLNMVLRPREQWREIELDEARRAIRLPRRCALDLGGIAKGWAADQVAVRYLTDFPAYLVDLGGDLRVRGGPMQGQPWLVGVERALQCSSADERVDAASSALASYVAGFELGAGAVATSGDARRSWRHEGHRMHHLIDPRTSRPVTFDGRAPRALTFTALAPTACEADVMAKVCFIRGYPAGLQVLDRGTRAAGLCVLEDGTVAASPNLDTYLSVWRDREPDR